MYIEETGASDGDIKVTVEGEEFTTEANYDLNGDGVDDTARVMTDDGYIAYIDENTDGHADLMQTVDAHGTVVSQSRFDPATGDWVPERPQQHPEPHPTRPENSLVVDTPHGDQPVGPATEDTNNDGKPDTAIVQNDKSTTMVTDIDGDGSADQMVEVTDTGDVTVSHHTGKGVWTVVERGRIDQNGQYTPNSPPHAVGTDDATWTFDESEPTTASDSDWL